MKVAIYSKNESFEQKMPQTQKSRLLNYVLQRGWNIINEFDEFTISDRCFYTERVKLMQLAKEKEIDVILVWSLNCWAESTSDLILSLDELSQYGVSFISLSESLDFSSPVGKSFSEILATLANFEKEKRILIKQNEHKNKITNNAHNRRLGKALKCAEEMKRLQLEGKNHSEIARTLNVSRGSVHNILGNSKKKKEIKKTYKRGAAQTLFCKSLYNIVNHLRCHSKIRPEKIK